MQALRRVQTIVVAPNTTAAFRRAATRHKLAVAVLVTSPMISLDALQAAALTPAELVAKIPSGAKVFVHGAAMTPTVLLEALAARSDVEDVELYHLHTAGTHAFVQPGVEQRVRSVSLFTGANTRKAIAEGRADFMPIFLADIPSLFTSGRVPLDVALVQVTPPDAHGCVSLGTSVDAAMAAVMSAKQVFAIINPRVPRTAGASSFPFRKISAYTISDRALVEHDAAEVGAVENAIGEIIAGLVEDGSTLQLGIGAIPDAVLTRLGNKLELGVHTEMFSDNLMPLIENGVVTNSKKHVHPGRTVTSFVSGSQRLFDFVNQHPLIEFHPCDRTNDTSLIRKNDKAIAINSAVEIDLSGQVCADSIGTTIFSGIGGQMDFIRGAALSRGGKPIIALPATARDGAVSRIAPLLKPGAGVVTTRGHVHYVVTEYGAVNLFGKTLRQRAELLISIAHPDFRAELRAAAAEIRHFDLA